MSHTTHEPSYAPFTGFGDDTNWSVKFSILAGTGGQVAEWQGGDQIVSRFRIANSGREVAQRFGFSPWEWTVRLEFASLDDQMLLAHMAGTEQTLRYLDGLTMPLDGVPETLLDVQYLSLPGTELVGIAASPFDPVRGGPREAMATFRRPYVAPVMPERPPWPEPPFPGFSSPYGNGTYGSGPYG
jgi:hypothetical protein